MRAVAVALLAGLAVLVAPLSVATQERPLPDPEVFFREARQRLQPDEARQSGYVYVETRRELKLDKSGRTTRESVDVFESYPGLPGQPRWQRQLQKDGRPVPPSELARQDRERQQKVTEYARRREQNPAQVEREEARRRADEQRELDEAIDDALRVYEMRMTGRAVVGGHDTVVITFTPRKNVRTRTRAGRVMKHFAGTAWVSESEYELVRLEAEAVETASFGLGLLARVHKGSRVAFERRKVNGEAWLPASASYTATARVMLLKMLRVGGTSEFSDYRKFGVTTELKVGTPK